MPPHPNYSNLNVSQTELLEQLKENEKSSSHTESHPPGAWYKVVSHFSPAVG